MNEFSVLTSFYSENHCSCKRNSITDWSKYSVQNTRILLIRSKNSYQVSFNDHNVYLFSEYTAYSCNYFGRNVISFYGLYYHIHPFSKKDNNLYNAKWHCTYKDIDTHFGSSKIMTWEASTSTSFEWHLFGPTTVRIPHLHWSKRFKKQVHCGMTKAELGAELCYCYRK